jgi:hypothetical protein
VCASIRSYILNLSGPEVLLLAYLFAAIKLSRVTSPLFLLSWAFQVGDRAQPTDIIIMSGRGLAD